METKNFIRKWVSKTVDWYLKMITVKTPYRISLFGGGTDFPEWFNNYSNI